MQAAQRGPDCGTQTAGSAPQGDGGCRARGDELLLGRCCRNHGKVVPEQPAPRHPSLHRPLLPPRILVGNAAPDTLAQQFPPWSQGMLLKFCLFPWQASWLGASERQHSPRCFGESPAAPAQPTVPSCHPNTAGHHVPHGKIDSRPLSHAIGLCSVQGGNTDARICQAGTSPAAMSCKGW